MTYLKVIASDGMFRNEYAICCLDYKDVVHSAFLDKRDVIVQDSYQGETPAYVAVDVIDKRNELTLVKLPTRLIGGSQYLTVRDRQITTRPIR